MEITEKRVLANIGNEEMSIFAGRVKHSMPYVW